MSTKSYLIWLGVGAAVGFLGVKFFWSTLNVLPGLGSLYTSVYNSGYTSSTG